MGVITYLVVLRTASQTNSYSFIREAIKWAYEKPLLTYLHAWFIAYGPIIVLPVYNWRRSLRVLATNQYMLICLFGFAVLGWIGGADTERYLFWGAPVVYLLIGQSIEDLAPLLKSRPLQVTLIFGQLISSRVFWTTPDFPNRYATPLPFLTPLTSELQFTDMWSYFGSRLINLVSFCQYVLLGASLLWWLNYRAAHVKRL
jgi:hypothetical protein